MGSWGFVFGALGFLAVWMVINASLVGYDKYPYILLNLVLSCVAALQGAILLIAAKRSDQIAGQLAHHDFEVNQEALAGIKQILVHMETQKAGCTCGSGGSGGSGTGGGSVVTLPLSVSSTSEPDGSGYCGAQPQ